MGDGDGEQVAIPAEPNRSQDGQIVIEPEPATASAAFYPPRVGVRQYLASEHLWNTRLMVRLAQARETDLLRAGFRGIDRELRAYVTAAVLGSVAYLEALVNSVWQDIADTDPANVASTAQLPQIPVEAINRMRELWNTNRVERSLTVFEKFQVALTCADQTRLDLGAEPSQTVEAIIHLRNALVHDKPELQWLDQDHRLQKRLQPRLGRNPLTDTQPWFLHQVLTAKCASIAHDSAVALAEEWRQRMAFTWSNADEAQGFANQIPTT